MLQFFKGKVQRWAAKQQREELVYYIDMLKGADVGARAMVVAAATDFRNVVMRTPEFLKAQADGTEIMFLHQMYKSAQQSNMQQIAAGIAVWIHTLRAEKELSNRYIAKEMWNLLASSFDEVEDAAEMLALFMGGRDLNIDGYNCIPVGFE
jgi:hypothetical protein